MEIFEDITALHEQVRQYVEGLEPGYKVTSIDGYFTSSYMLPLGQMGELNPEKITYVHALTDARFRVSAEYVPAKQRKLSVTVYVTFDGKLHAGDRLASY